MKYMGINMKDDEASLANARVVDIVGSAFKEKHVVDGDGRLTVELGGDVGEVNRQRLHNRLGESIRAISAEVGIKIPVVGSGLVIVSGELAQNIGLGTDGCINYSVMAGGDLATESTVFIETGINQMKADDVGVGLMDQLEEQIVHESTHAVIAQYCVENGIDVHHPRLRMFSELVPAEMEYKDRGEILDQRVAACVNDELQEKPPVAFPGVLTPEVMYYYLPSFFKHLANKCSTPDLALKMLKARVGDVVSGAHEGIKPPKEKIDAGVARKMVSLGMAAGRFGKTQKMSDVVDYSESDDEKLAGQIVGLVAAVVASGSLLGEKSGTYGGDRNIPSETVDWMSMYVAKEHGADLAGEWKKWRSGVMGE